MKGSRVWIGAGRTMQMSLMRFYCPTNWLEYTYACENSTHAISAETESKRASALHASRVLCGSFGTS